MGPGASPFFSGNRVVPRMFSEVQSGSDKANNTYDQILNNQLLRRALLFLSQLLKSTAWTRTLHFLTSEGDLHIRAKNAICQCGMRSEAPQRCNGRVVGGTSALGTTNRSMPTETRPAILRRGAPSTSILPKRPHIAPREIAASRKRITEG